MPKKKQPRFWRTDLVPSTGDLNTVRDVIRCGEAQVDDAGASERRALHRAAGANQVAIIHFLLSEGATLDIKDRLGRTPLHWACISGHTDAAQTLLASGADPMAHTSSRMTPLHGAAATGMGAVVELLLSYAEGAPEACLLEAMRSAIDGDGKTPAELASDRGDKVMAKAIKSWGATASLSKSQRSRRSSGRSNGEETVPAAPVSGGGGGGDGGSTGPIGGIWGLLIRLWQRISWSGGDTTGKESNQKIGETPRGNDYGSKGKA